MNALDSFDYTKWKDSLYQQARVLIETDPESFTVAGHQLAQTFSCEFIHRMDADEPDSPRHGWPPERLLLGRICFARSAAIGQSQDHLNQLLDFRFVGKIKQRLFAAHQVVLAILLAADADANDYISPQMCELAELQHETMDEKILGREFVPWDWEKRDTHLCPGLKHHSCPTPYALATLEAACKLIEMAGGQINRQQSFSRVETKSTPRESPVTEFIQLEQKHIGVLKWLAHPSRRNRTWCRHEVDPDDLQTPTSSRYLRAIINHLNDLGLVDSPPRRKVKITLEGLDWLERDSQGR